jgi:hypothetical protein
MITPEQIKMLNEPFPRSAVKERKQGGRGVSYAEGHYIIRKLNAIFGNGSWSYSCATREVYREQLDDGEKGQRWHVSYGSTCRLSVAAGHEIVDVGHGHGIDRECGAAIESAEKEAATDSLKRCAKSLGDALALALYSKGQEHVHDGPPPFDDAPARAMISDLRSANAVVIEVMSNRARTIMRGAPAELAAEVREAFSTARARIASGAA